MLTVERSVPLLEGLELAVKDDELSPSSVSSSLDHHRHMGIAGFGFAIAACVANLSRFLLRFEALLSPVFGLADGPHT